MADERTSSETQAARLGLQLSQGAEVVAEHPVFGELAVGDAPDVAEGRPQRPLGNESINKTLAVLAAILEDTLERGWLATNPARGVADASRRPDLTAPSSSPTSSTRCSRRRGNLKKKHGATRRSLVAKSWPRSAWQAFG